VQLICDVMKVLLSDCTAIISVCVVSCFLTLHMKQLVAVYKEMTYLCDVTVFKIILGIINFHQGFLFSNFLLTSKSSERKLGLQ